MLAIADFLEIVWKMDQLFVAMMSPLGVDRIYMIKKALIYDMN